MNLPIRITEIFFSLQGESLSVGIPTVFIRLTGCPLRCHYCDTEYAFSGGDTVSIAEILEQIQRYKTKYITVTGGEPLAQKNCVPLLTALCDGGYTVSLETSGALCVADVDPRVIKVMDIKTPGSGEHDRNMMGNLEFLSDQDQIKFVICDQKDYTWAKECVSQHHLDQRCHILFSPSHDTLSNKQLAEWILADKLPVRFQLQLHKYIWGDVPGH